MAEIGFDENRSRQNWTQKACELKPGAMQLTFPLELRRCTPDCNLLKQEMQRHMQWLVTEGCPGRLGTRKDPWNPDVVSIKLEFRDKSTLNYYIKG